MKQMRLAVLSTLSGVLCLAGALRAETKVELKGVHLCCPACVSAVGKIVKTVDGAKAKCDQRKKTIAITAEDDQTAQKVLDALAAGGFHGTTGNKDLAIKDDSGATAGKVQSLKVSGIHNCCGQCNNGIKATLKKVDGVKGNTAKAKSDSFEVTGDFDPIELVKALNSAGFHVKVEK
jgi:periplasmic mercuric ion binding protein